MEQSKNTRKSLLSSILSIFVCVTLLIGLTLAWFTDNVTSEGNVIASGNLDVTLEWKYGHKNLGNGEWEDASKGPIFNQDKWEPGYTLARHIKVGNAGNLALKYEMYIEPTGEVGNLAEVIDVYYIKGGQKLENRTDLKEENRIGTLKELMAKSYIAKGHILEGKSDIATIAFKMQESAGNDYQGQGIGSSFNIKLVATQYAHEKDSFGTDYDEGVEYPISSSEELKEAIENAEPGDVLRLNDGKFDIVVANFDIPEGVSIIGQEGSIIQLNSGSPDDTYTAGMLIENDNVTISNVKITGKNMGSKDYNSYIRITGDNVTLDNITIEALYTTVSPIRIDNTEPDNEITIKNSTIYSTSGRAIYIVDGANGTVHIDNTDITGVYPINVNSSSSQELVLDVTNSKLHGWISYGNIKSASFKNTEFSKGDSSYEFIRPYANTTFTDCEFADGFKVGAGAIGKTYTFVNCEAAGVKLTADNVEEKLLDMSGSDETNLKGCTIIVDGVSMTPGI